MHGIEGREIGNNRAIRPGGMGEGEIMMGPGCEHGCPVGQECGDCRIAELERVLEEAKKYLEAFHKFSGLGNTILDEIKTVLGRERTDIQKILGADSHGRK